MKRITEEKTKRKHSYVEVETNTAECIVADVCAASMIITMIVSWVSFLKENV